jgi:hypothetical protein
MQIILFEHWKALRQAKLKGLLKFRFLQLPPTQPPTRKSKDSSICQALNQSQTILGLLKWKTTSIFSKMEDDLIFVNNGRRPQFFEKMEDDLQ